MNENSTYKDGLEQEGMAIYQYIVDHCDTCSAEMSELISRMRGVDTTGQFLASTARYLAAVDRETFEPWLAPLIEGAIDRDRERRYIGSLLKAIWGEDYEDRAEELKAADNNFRRIYKRIYPENSII
ncbi:MAG: hypothetical protein K2M87_06555 [Muribaculaceae bacterium]|nr:hypothetical protein [Muribaculaceae bacterium]